ncbi:MAG: serpin family protein [Fermentimonas sp.]|jgi:serine protease inhibitor
MKRILQSLIVVVLAIMFNASSCDKKTDEMNKDVQEISTAELRSAEDSIIQHNRSFAFELFNNVLKAEQQGSGKSFMVSPISLSMAMAMVWNGAEGETKTQIQNTLGFEGVPDQAVNLYYKNLKDSVLSVDSTTKIAIANSIWTNKNIKIKSDFLDKNNRYFNSTVESMDFGSPATAQRINQWTADNTNNLIKDVMQSTNPMDLMYVLNAVYFKGTWTSKFDASQTKERPFTLENGQKTTVGMMEQEADFIYAEDDVMQAVMLPYGNRAFSMTVLLPKEGKKVADVAQHLQDAETWTNIMSQSENYEVKLSLPKFKTEYNTELNNVLQQMGITQAFQSGSADFSAMSDAEAFISAVNQFTYIETDEVGTEAAATTVIGIRTTSLQPQKPHTTFNANKPFVYVIQENYTGAILFMGAVTDFSKQ